MAKPITRKAKKTAPMIGNNIIAARGVGPDSSRAATDMLSISAGPAVCCCRRKALADDRLDDKILLDLEEPLINEPGERERPDCFSGCREGAKFHEGRF